MAEDGNHLAWDLSLLEDKSKIRTGCGPENNAALIKRSGKFAAVPEGMAHYTANREAAPETLLTRQKGNAAQAAGQPSSLGAARWERGRFARETAPGGRGVECAWRASGETPPSQRPYPAHLAAHPERPVGDPEPQ